MSRRPDATWWVCEDHAHELELSRASGSRWSLRLLHQGCEQWTEGFEDEPAAREAAGEVMSGYCCADHDCADWWCLLNHGIIKL